MTDRKITSDLGKFAADEKMGMQMLQEKVLIQKKFLVNFGQALGVIQDRKQLSALLNDQVKDYAGFLYATFFVLNENEEQMEDFLFDPKGDKAKCPFCASVTIAKYPVDDKINRIYQENRDIPAYDLSDLYETENVIPFLRTDYNSSSFHSIVLNLGLGANNLGKWILLFEKKETITEEILDTLQLLAVQLSLVIFNIKSSERLDLLGTENEIIHSLNVDLASVTEKGDLMRILHHKLKKLFDFGHHFVAMINDDQLTMTTLLRDEMSVARFHPRYNKVTHSQFPINDHILNKVLLSEVPVVFDLDSLRSNGDMPEYMTMNNDSGVKKMVMMGLHVRSRIIGVWVICLLENQNVSPKNLNRIKQISYQLSIMCDNLKVNERIKEKEVERGLLLQLSSSISNIKDKKDLFIVINGILKKLFLFKEIIIMILNDDDTYSPFLFSSDRKDPQYNYYSKLVGNRYPVSDGIFDKVMQSPHAVGFDMLMPDGPHAATGYIAEEYKNGIRKKMGIRLRDDNKDIGVMFINDEFNIRYTEDELRLIYGVSLKLSTAVANILAHAEIVKRDEERELHLSLIREISAVRNNNELLQVITNKLKELIGFTHILIGTLNDDKKTFSRIFVDPGSKCVNHQDYQNMLAIDKFSINDGVIDKILASDYPQCFRLEELIEEQELPNYLQMNWESGIKSIVTARFSRGGCPFGFWTMFFEKNVPASDHTLKLIQGITYQISIVVSNMIANEKIRNQLEEITQYKLRLEEEKVYLTEEIETTHNYSEIIGESPAIQKTFRLVAQVSGSDSTVLLLGETGTGKELIARALHNNSPRKNKMMVKVNCAALPVNLIESELFGHERGSFTGATDRRLGKFELAHGGTLFLDEIGDMPLDLQVKLLRVLQEKEIERIGGRNTIKVDVRIIAATNRDLAVEVAEGRFRSDLYYRINIFPIFLPSLRERKEDIPLLSKYFIQRFAKKLGKKINTLSSSALHSLSVYDWPGNIRELEHLMERSVLLATSDTLHQIHLPMPKQVSSASSGLENIFKTIEQNEKEHILTILKYSGGKISGEGGAAFILGVPPSTLNSKMKKLGVKKEYLK